MNQSEENIRALVEALARGETVSNANVEADAPGDAELDLRVSKLAVTLPGLTSSGTITDSGISSEVVLVHE